MKETDDIVHARLPRPIAEAVGATIYDDAEAAHA